MTWISTATVFPIKAALRQAKTWSEKEFQEHYSSHIETGLFNDEVARGSREGVSFWEPPAQQLLPKFSLRESFLLDKIWELGKWLDCTKINIFIPWRLNIFYMLQ